MDDPKIILSEPGRYGFRFTPLDLYPPLRFDRLELHCSQETPLFIIAQAANTGFKRIKDLNPELRGYFLAAGSHRILVPEGAADGFQKRFQLLADQWEAEKKVRIYVVKAGDNLSAIAERFNVPLPALLIWNQLNFNKPIHPGDRLVVYPQDTE